MSRRLTNQQLDELFAADNGSPHVEEPALEWRDWALKTAKETMADKDPPVLRLQQQLHQHQQQRQQRASRHDYYSSRRVTPSSSSSSHTTTAAQPPAASPATATAPAALQTQLQAPPPGTATTPAPTSSVEQSPQSTATPGDPATKKLRTLFSDPPLCFCQKEAACTDSPQFGIIYDCHYMSTHPYFRSSSSTSITVTAADTSTDLTAPSNSNNSSSSTATATTTATDSEEKKPTHICGFHVHRDAWSAIGQALQNREYIDKHSKELEVCPYFNFTFCVTFRLTNNFKKASPLVPRCFCNRRVKLSECDFRNRRRICFVCPNFFIDGAKPKCSWFLWAEELAFDIPKYPRHNIDAMLVDARALSPKSKRQQQEKDKTKKEKEKLSGNSTSTSTSSSLSFSFSSSSSQPTVTISRSSSPSSSSSAVATVDKDQPNPERHTQQLLSALRHSNVSSSSSSLSSSLIQQSTERKDKQAAAVRSSQPGNRPHIPRKSDPSSFSWSEDEKVDDKNKNDDDNGDLDLTPLGKQHSNLNQQGTEINGFSDEDGYEDDDGAFNVQSYNNEASVKYRDNDYHDTGGEDEYFEADQGEDADEDDDDAATARPYQINYIGTTSKYLTSPSPAAAHSHHSHQHVQQQQQEPFQFIPASVHRNELFKQRSATDSATLSAGASSSSASETTSKPIQLASLTDMCDATSQLISRTQGYLLQHRPLQQQQQEQQQQRPHEEDIVELQQQLKVQELISKGLRDKMAQMTLRQSDLESTLTQTKQQLSDRVEILEHKLQETRHELAQAKAEIEKERQQMREHVDTQTSLRQHSQQQLTYLEESYESVLEERNELLVEAQAHEIRMTTKEQQLKCQVCYSNDVECAILPCFHSVYCLTCAGKINECALCRSPKLGVQKVYLCL